jgi:hypothetical protein
MLRTLSLLTIDTLSVEVQFVARESQQFFHFQIDLRDFPIGWLCLAAASFIIGVAFNWNRLHT